VVPVEHIHRPLVNVADESRKVIDFLRSNKSMSFRALCADAGEPMIVIARFLALLDLYRTGSLRFEQVIALGELQISWIGTESGDVAVSDEFDIAVVAELDEEGSDD
jgi:segregation and condensation protein A